MNKRPSIRLDLPPQQQQQQQQQQDSPLKYVDSSGNLNFSGKAVLHAQGVDFSEGISYKIALNQLQIQEELGRGQFGVVHKIFHKPTNVTMAMKQIRLEISESAFRQIIMELEVLHKAHSGLVVEFYGAFFLEDRLRRGPACEPCR